MSGPVGILVEVKPVITLCNEKAQSQHFEYCLISQIRRTDIICKSIIGFPAKNSYVFDKSWEPAVSVSLSVT